MDNIKIGTKVEWSSQAQGSWATKKGQVVAIVPPGKLAWELDDFDYSQYRKITPEVCNGRDHISYLVAVQVGKTDKAKKKIYWPNVTNLKHKEI